MKFFKLEDKIKREITKKAVNYVGNMQGSGVFSTEYYNRLVINKTSELLEQYKKFMISN